MADLTYLLEFAEVPFVGDVSRIVRGDIPGEQQQHYVNRQRSEADLMAEIERILPLKYLSDVGHPSSYLGRNLGAIASLNRTETMDDPIVYPGTWVYPISASRWSTFRGLATSSMVKAMLERTGGNNPDQFVMQCFPVSPNKNKNVPNDYRIETQMYMLPPRPIGEQGGTFDGLYLVTLVDERYSWADTPASIQVKNDTTWDWLILQLGLLLNVVISWSTISPSYGQPEPDSQLWTNAESASALLDAVAYSIGRVVVRKFDGSYALLTPLESQTIALNNRGNANKVERMAGGDLFSSGTKLPVGNLTAAKNSVIPASVSVTFPKYVYGNDPVPHFVNPRYTNQRQSAWYEESYGAVFTVPIAITSGGPLVSGLTGISDHFIHSTAKALYSGEINISSPPINASGLTALALKVSEDYYNSQIAVALDEVYPGCFAWQPEGFHDILWTYSERLRQASTRVMRTEWNASVREMQHGTPPLSGFTNTPAGVGGQSVAQSYRDSFSGGISTLLASNMLSGASSASFADVGCFPTQNRWRGQIDQEKILFEGTSGGTGVDVVYRGIDGTKVVPHYLLSGASVSQLIPDTSYGVNLVTHEKAQFAFPSEWTSGGIAGVNIVPQTQSVFVTSDTPTTINGIPLYPGLVSLYDTTKPLASRFATLESVWTTDRNSNPLTSGRRYDGQYAGVSPTPPKPVYLVDEQTPGVIIDNVNNIITITNYDIDYTSTVNYFSEVTYYSQVNYLSIVNYTLATLYFPYTCTPGIPTETPGGAFIWWNGGDGVLQLYDPCLGRWLCFSPDPECPPPHTTGGGVGSGSTTCDCTECPNGAPTVWSLHIASVDDFTYSALVGSWWLQYVGSCTWVAEDDDGNSWTLVFSAGTEVLTGTTSGGDTVVYDVSTSCCEATTGGLASSSTGNLTVPQTVALQPVGECGPCPPPPDPPDGPGTCGCLQCPDGAPEQWSMTVAGMTGAFTSLNDDWLLNYAGQVANDFGDCIWISGDPGNITYPYWMLFWNAARHQWRLHGYISASVWIYYEIDEDEWDCCGDNTLAFDIKNGAGSYPSTLTVSPIGDCDCGGGDSNDIESSCCPGALLPRQMLATVVNTAGACDDCMEGFTATLVHDDLMETWLTPDFQDNPCGPPTLLPLINVLLRCTVDDVWDLGFTGGVATLDEAESTCDPLHLVFHVESAGVCSPGAVATFDVIITEIP